MKITADETNAGYSSVKPLQIITGIRFDDVALGRSAIDELWGSIGVCEGFLQALITKVLHAKQDSCVPDALALRKAVAQL